jgi:hypothetical protein
MAKETEGQRRTVDLVMHEYKHGELKSGKKGAGGKVKSRKQAIAVALSEAGESNRTSKKKNARNLRHTKAKEAKGKTAMQEKEGKAAKTRTELYEMAKKRDIPGRSKMNKAQLQRALRSH